MLIVAHDAGGAEVVSAWVKYNFTKYNFAFLLGGPASNIFPRKLGNIKFSLLLEDIIGQAIDFVLTGSSWGSDLEINTIEFACKNGLPVATYLDHWTNYRRRFQTNERLILPDEIWVGDEYAFKLATQEFPDTVIKLVHNYYFKEIVRDVEIFSGTFAQTSRDARKRILYVCEPRTMNYGNPNFWGYTEFEALDGYLQYLHQQTKNIENVRVRLHPSEPSKKYNAILDKYRGILPIEEGSKVSLAHDCAWADWIVGCDSMAMVMGVLTGKQVFSCIPPHGRPMSLPFSEIIQLFNNISDTHPVFS